MNRMQALQAAVPVRHQSNFLHLYFDIAWFGLLSGSAMSFISVYLVRIGASAFQIGLMNAAPAVVTIALAIPAGVWLKRRPIDRAVLWSSVLHRFFYLFWVPLPMLFAENSQVWIVIAITLLMSIPGTALAVGFNAMFADAVPPEWRGHVVGIRNAVLAITTIAASLACGYLLSALEFPINYQLVFLIGVIGALMSSYHLHRIRVTEEDYDRVGRTLGDLAQPGLFRTVGDAMRSGVALRYLTRMIAYPWRQLRSLHGPFRLVLLALFLFHLTQFIAIPLFPIFWVERLGLTDQNISVGTALFNASIFLGSTQLSRLTKRFGSHGITVAGALLMASYPGLTALTQNVALFLATSVVGGIAWSMAGGALGNYLLEKIPPEDRPAYLAWYLLLSNVAVLGGSLIGPAIAGQIGLVATLAVAAGLRVLSAIGILRLGSERPAADSLE